MCSNHTWAQGGELSRISPPEKFWVEIPPHREGYSLAKYSPPSEKFFPHPKNSPPKIWKKWQFLWIPPLNFVNFLGSPPWRRWLFGSLDSPPKNFSKSLPPDGLRCSPMYGSRNFQCVKLGFHFVKIRWFYSHSDFTWNQIWAISHGHKMSFLSARSASSALRNDFSASFPSFPSFPSSALF